MALQKPHKALQLRLPIDVKDWIAAQAKASGASQNSEIVRAVRERMERKQKDLEQARG